jgi:hypothetical protein
LTIAHEKRVHINDHRSSRISTAWHFTRAMLEAVSDVKERKAVRNDESVVKRARSSKVGTI